jgi:hypothetical protein
VLSQRMQLVHADLLGLDNGTAARYNYCTTAGWMGALPSDQWRLQLLMGELCIRAAGLTADCYRYCLVADEPSPCYTVTILCSQVPRTCGSSSIKRCSSLHNKAKAGEEGARLYVTCWRYKA